MLSKNCSEWSTGKNYISGSFVTLVKWCRTVLPTVCQCQGCCWTSIYKKVEIKKLTIILTSEANLQPSQTTMMDHFYKNIQQLKVVNYFCQKTPSQMFVWVLNTPLYPIGLIYQKRSVSTKKMIAVLAHKKYFKKQKIVKRKIGNINKKQ